METNFDYLLEKSEYASFAEQAVEAEKSIAISPATCAILSRRALELAVRFVFSYDAELSLPYQDNVSSLIHEPTFRNIIEREGIAIAKREGKYKGRKAISVPNISDYYQKYMTRQGTKTSIAAELGISLTSLYKLFKAYEKNTH